MNRRRSLGRYRAIDLTLFAAILFVFENLIVSAGTRMFPGTPYLVSVTPAVTAIVMMRWGPFAAAHALLGGLVYVHAAGGSAAQYAIMGAGNLFALAVLGLRKSLGAESIRQSSGKTVLFGLCTVLLMQTGRAAVSLALGVGLPGAALFFTSDVITDLFTALVVWIARRTDGLFEDQRHYLARLEKERVTEEGGFR